MTTLDAIFRWSEIDSIAFPKNNLFLISFNYKNKIICSIRLLKRVLLEQNSLKYTINEIHREILFKITCRKKSKTSYYTYGRFTC